MRGSWNKASLATMVLAITLLFPALSHAACSENGAGCWADYNCCSGICDEGTGYCMACLPEGSGCGDSSECCSGNVCSATLPHICEEPAATAENWYDNLYIWVALSVVISSAVIGLAYMAAKAFEVQILEAWVKIELQELMSSIVIAVFCIGLIASANTAAKFLVGGSSGDNIAEIASNSYLRDVVYTDGKMIHSALGETYFHLASQAYFSYTKGLSIGIISWSSSGSPASGLSPLVSQVSQGMDTVSNFMMLAAAQAAFLKFFSTASVVMLPVSIFLRSFSLTRKVGGVLLAGVIAASVVYPAGMLVSREVYNEFAQPMRSLISGLVQEIPKFETVPGSWLVCNPFSQLVVESPLGYMQQKAEIGWKKSLCGGLVDPYKKICEIAVMMIFPIVKSILTLGLSELTLSPVLKDLENPDIVDKFYDPIRDHALPAVAQYSVLSLVSFLIPIIITISLLRSLAVTFGGEPQLYGLSKLV